MAGSLAFGGEGGVEEAGEEGGEEVGEEGEEREKRSFPQEVNNGEDLIVDVDTMRIKIRA